MSTPLTVPLGGLKQRNSSWLIMSRPISETGADISRFPTVGHFASWLGLCPGTKITGGKVMSGKTKRSANRAAQALRLAAAAHKLARLIYTMLTKGEECTDQGQDYYEERSREWVLRQLSQRAQKLGMQLVAAEQPV